MTTELMRNLNIIEFISCGVWCRIFNNNNPKGAYYDRTPIMEKCK
ncbi:MAG: hypothetical protein ACR2LL_08695 [Nitrosopumilus sp.]